MWGGKWKKNGIWFDRSGYGKNRTWFDFSGYEVELRSFNESLRSRQGEDKE